MFDYVFGRQNNFDVTIVAFQEWWDNIVPPLLFIKKSLRLIVVRLSKQMFYCDEVHHNLALLCCFKIYKLCQLRNSSRQIWQHPFRNSLTLLRGPLKYLKWSQLLTIAVLRITREHRPRTDRRSVLASTVKRITAPSTQQPLPKTLGTPITMIMFD